MEVNQKIGLIVTQLEDDEIRIAAVVVPPTPEISIMDFTATILEGLAFELRRTTKLDEVDCLTVMGEMIGAVLDSKLKEEKEKEE
jgi:hypothetical protein